MIIPKNITYFALLAFFLAIFIVVYTGLKVVFFGYLIIMTFIAIYDFISALKNAKNIELKFDKIYQLQQLAQRSLSVKFINKSLDRNYKINGITFIFPDFFNNINHEQKLEIQPRTSTNFEIELISNNRGTIKDFCCYFLSVSPLGLWNYRHKVENESSEIRIYPDTFSEQKKMSALFLNKRIGSNNTITNGKSLDFDHLREYQAGDSIDLIDWKATAKKGFPVSRIYNNESSQTIYVIIDTSKLSMQKKNHRSNLDYYLASALNLANLTARNKDSFGLIIFDENIRKFVIAKHGINNIKLCRNEILDIQATDTIPDYNKLFSFIRNKIHQRSLLFFMTDLSNSLAAEDFSYDLHLVNKKHLCMVNALKNEHLMPILNKKITEETEIYEAISNHVQWQQLNILAKKLRTNNVGSCFSSRKNLSVDLVNTYLNVKRRHLL